MSSPPKPPIKAVFFDFMGTCLDWHTSVTQSLPLDPPTASSFALEWRRQYFLEIAQLHSTAQPVEDIDTTLARVLDALLRTHPQHTTLFPPAAKTRAIAAWHAQPAWPDVAPALQRLRARGNLELFVHANGTPRLQLDLARSSGLRFDMLFSSALLGAYKPSREAYEKAMALVKVRPEEVVMVAAHAYDLRGARGAGGGDADGVCAAVDG